MVNWSAVIPTGVVVIVLFIIVLIKNRKDRRELENQINQDYPKPTDPEADVEEREKI